LPNSTVCVDASVILKLVIREDGSDVARELWAHWLSEGTEVVAPRLLFYETTSALRNKVHRGLMSENDGTYGLERILKLQITLIQTPDLHTNAWQLAKRLNRPSAYDASYLAVAAARDCALWTADTRLYNAVKDGFPAIHLIG
jgi:predicted nucleic acid-binding protein